MTAKRPQTHALLFLFLLGMVGTGTPHVVCGDDSPQSRSVDNVPTKNPETFESTIKPFLHTYCVGCHGAKQQKGERRFDALDSQIRDDNSLVDYQDILDQLNLGEMPPPKSKQPSDVERRNVTGWLARQIEARHQTRLGLGGQTVLRRLNAREYRNTVRDLLDLNMTMFDPTTEFPKDQTSEHLDNIGDTLVMSGHLLARYLDAADRVIDKALLPSTKPTIQKWVFRDNFRQQPEIDQVHRTVNRFEHMTLYDVVGADKHEGAYGPIMAFKQGVSVDGYYDIRLKAEAVNRIHPYDPKFLGTDPNEPLRLGIVAGNYLAGQLHKPQPVEPLLAEMDLADESKWYKVRVWLDAGFTPRFTFRNGLMDTHNLWSRLLRKYPDQFPASKGIVETRFNAIKHGKLPQIHIHEIEIEGPHFSSWPTPSQKSILGEDCEQILASGSLSEAETREIIARFLARAYRRPVRETDVDRILQVVSTRRLPGRTSLAACADGLKAALCSPHFLYLEEARLDAKAATDDKSDSSRLLSPSALASRLSYFLWSSMPDQTLMALATSDALLQSEMLEAQVLRMLADSKSEAFVDGFLGSWLALRELGATPPDRNQFREFYHYDLDAAMRQETRMFMRHVIDNNLSVVNFLDADFTFVNKPLARHYGMVPLPAAGFERVNITDRRRGGLLGQASILTVTANGIDTSPVVRGVWMLENILGTPPSPPPPDVEPLDPDIRGAKTVRDQLKKHRSVASCNDCHRKIDPLGFALENFDPIGKWRNSYGRKTKVDASGELPGGESFDDVQGLKRILVSHKDQFTRALTKKLLAYAMGRQLIIADRPAVDQLLASLEVRNDGFRDLVQLIVKSSAFRSK